MWLIRDAGTTQIAALVDSALHRLMGCEFRSNQETDLQPELTARIEIIHTYQLYNNNDYLLALTCPI
jgi:hypothetical protein